MKKNKIKKYETEEQAEIKKFIFVLGGLVIIIIGIYFFTRAFVTKDLFKETDALNYQKGVVNEDIVIVGNMLNRPYEEYYVLAFNSEDNNSVYYNTIVSNYMKEKEALKVFYLDLNNELNKKYVATGDEYTTSFKSIEDLQLGSISLLKIKNKKVTKMITNLEEIKKELNNKTE